MCIAGFFLLSLTPEPQTFIRYDVLVTNVRVPKITGTSIISVSTRQKAEIYFYNLEGSAYLKVFQDSVLTLTGKYVSDGKIYKSESTVADFEGNATGTVINNIYHPVRDSIWNYYDLTGRLVRTETYNNGCVAGVMCY